MNPPYRLLLGTNNPGKTMELIALLDGLNLDICKPVDLGQELNVDEVGNNYLENALLKAQAWSKQSGIATLADDSGLEVDALHGAPGVLSHRITGVPAASDAERRKFLLLQLTGLSRPWTARFKCAIVVAVPGRESITGTGFCEGEIISEERGTNGFGYDPIFLVHGTGKTMAELSMAEKNQLSHRARAMESICPMLAEILYK